MSNYKDKIIFWGTPEFAVPSLKSLIELKLVKAIVTQPDRPAGRGKKLSPSPVKLIAQENKIAILEPEKLDQNFVIDLQKYLPATYVVVAYGKIIPQTALDLSELSAINIHPSRLPELRGPSPIQTAILRGFTNTAVSLMQLDKKMDHGPILGQIEAKIDKDDNYLSLSNKLADLAAKLLTINIKDYLSGNLKPINQDDSLATYCQLIKKEDGQISWEKPAQVIYNQIRAFYVWPGAYTKINDLDFKIFKSQINSHKLNPNQMKVLDNKLLIGTGTQALEILELQLAGKNKITAAEFVRGYKNKL